MPGQKTLTSFFSPIASRAKRTLSSIENNAGSPVNGSDVKKLKSDENKLSDKTEENTTPKSPKASSPIPEQKISSLSPEQKKRIAEKKQEALKKLQNKSTPIGFGETWAVALSQEFTKPYFVKLQQFVELERKSKTIFPPPHQVFSWTQMCKINEVKVVILGQDPYHNYNQAHGLCFSVQKGIKLPPSLENMFKELVNDIEGFKPPGHGDLTGWAKQGVLLLNSCLTVRAHEANSHKDQGWEKFTDAVISWLNKNRTNLVFILWGSYAQKKGSIIDTKKHLVLKGVHPSPLSAHRGYFGCKHFSKANNYLIQHSKKPIDWTKL